MEPTTIGVAAARAVGQLGAAAVSRYKPVGVARIGSPEDRAQHYRRLLDASAQHRLAVEFFAASQLGGDKHPLYLESLRHMMATGSELVCAVHGVQLCAPEYVISAAQKVADAVQVRGDEAWETYRQCQVAFLNAARHDLDYNPKRWQFWKRRKAKSFAVQPPTLTMQG
ncbi:hypothetical protein [Streptomyces sp. NPDC102409]|uniref:hypothetical protein n=1 Tax=Streptomyces sp. NPDC102409 TaxID=3366172 RepID=UPI003809BAD6